MSTNVLDRDRCLAFVHETDTAITFIDEGLRKLIAWKGGDDRRFVSMQLLAQGFERYFKVIKALLQLNTESTLPTSKQFRTEYRHDLSRILDDIVETCRQDGRFINRPAIRSDLEFLSSDNHWRKMLGILSEFGSRGHYHDLDTMLDGPSDAPSPLERLESLENDLFHAEPRLVDVAVTRQQDDRGISPSTKISFHKDNEIVTTVISCLANALRLHASKTRIRVV